MRISYIGHSIMVAVLLISAACEKKEDNTPEKKDALRLISARVGKQDLSTTGQGKNMPLDKPVVLTFNLPLDTSTAKKNIELVTKDSVKLPLNVYFLNNNKTVSLFPKEQLKPNTLYLVEILDGLKGAEGETFKGKSLCFDTETGTLKIESIMLNGENFDKLTRIKGIDFQVEISVNFNEALESEGLEKHISLTGPEGTVPVSINLLNKDSTLRVENDQPLDYYKEFSFRLDTGLTTPNKSKFEGFRNNFFTRLDSSSKFPVISEEALLTKIQKQTFRYFWDHAHPVSGLIHERVSSDVTVTSGGSGFGLMAILVGIERGFITRGEGIDRLDKILTFLEDSAERFHGAWSHWLNGSTGEAIPFSEKDDGGDLVETSYMAQGLITVREYLNPSNPQEDTLITQINRLWKGIEWDWYTQEENVLYWHWSPNYGFEKNLPIRGYNETLITYIMAASSPTHSIKASVYHKGFAKSGNMQNGNKYYGYQLPLGPAYGGPLFFAHYSYLGLDPRNLEDQYADYWEQNTRHVLINHAYCVENPRNYVGYSNISWGLTASDNHEGYSAHSPTNDLGVITPTAAVASLPYTPEKSMKAIKHFYYHLGDRLWGPYGFYDAFNVTENWYADSYLAIDQGPIILMIENYRSGMLWDLFMSAPEVQSGLDKLGFRY